MAMLEVEGLTKQFGGVIANNEISFSVQEGEILGLIGPNGAGTSTLLELLTGLHAPDRGTLRFPVRSTVRVGPDRIEALETHADSLARLGIELRAAGPQSVALYAFPSLLERVNPAVFVRELLDVLSESAARPETDTLLHDLLDMMACKAAVKAGDPLTREEIESLLAAKVDSQRSSNCPHGRPTTLHLSLRDLQRQFKRR